jgi:hypothetical protein
MSRRWSPRRARNATFQSSEGVPLAAPPSASSIDPLIVELPTGTTLFRVHGLRLSPSSFNPGRGTLTRFAPLQTPDGTPIPTLYASTSVAGALSETVFHDVPYRGRGKRILASRLVGLGVSSLEIARPIRLAYLAGLGLRRLGLRRRDLIESTAAAYPLTVSWALALHECPLIPSGLLWTSRQDDTASALLLFGDRVAEDALAVSFGPIPLDSGPGLALVHDAASLAAITVFR